MAELEQSGHLSPEKGSAFNLATLPQHLRGSEGAGFVRFDGFVDQAHGRGMLEDIIELVRSESAGTKSGSLVLPEGQTDLQVDQPEDAISKIFKLHRRPRFQQLLKDPRVVDILTHAIGPDVDCFLSQFIFKNPGAWGQPWHQDSFYFEFEPARPIVGLWLAVTEATLENGCLHILPGSQTEPVHMHIPDRRPNANYGYQEIVDHDMSASEPCLMGPGDLLVFDSHLMHRSTDNRSSGRRAAMVWHCAAAGTVEPGRLQPNGERVKSPVHDWMPLLRDGACVLT